VVRSAAAYSFRPPTAASPSQPARQTGETIIELALKQSIGLPYGVRLKTC